MQRDRRFFAGLVGVAAIVTYLVWTGLSGSVLYYVTPAELLAQADDDPQLLARAVKVSGNVVPGSHEQSTDELMHTFIVEDPEDPSIRLVVEFSQPLPATFTDEAEVVMDGQYLGNGRFAASEVLTKCGSRYEAMPEEAEASESGEGGVAG